MDNTSPKNTIAVILGAYEWPNASFSTSDAFKNSVEAMEDYLLESFGLPKKNILNLFNTEKTAPDQIVLIGEFIRNCEEKAEAGNPLENLLLYYVGHGAIHHENNEFFLAIRATKKNYEYATSLHMRGLGDCLKERTRGLRRFLLLDCCFASTATSVFQSEQLQVAIRKTAEVFPSHGTIMLCSSSRHNPSKAPKGRKYTMFSGALFHVLTTGYKTDKSHFSISEICELAWMDIQEQYQDEAIRPEWHSPDQSEGNLADFPLFPNPMYKSDRQNVRSYEFLSKVSSKLLEQNGNKRTAYPIDMSFRELFEKQVYIPPCFFIAYEITENPMDLNEFINRFDTARNILVLGEPGSGKSFFTYLIQQLVAQFDSKVHPRICLPLDIRIFIESLANQAEDFDIQILLSILWDNYEGKEICPFQDIDPDSEILFIVDGIDELSSNPSQVKMLTLLLNGLAKIGSVLVTCRTQDFEYIFAPHIKPSYFDLILKIKEWEVESEFSEFIQKLEHTGLPVEKGLLKRVKDSDMLSSLVRRPLHARMLTFISKDIGEMTDVSQLYSVYLDKYATIVKSYLTNEGFYGLEPYLLWQECAWHAFHEDLFVHDEIPLDVLNDFLVKHHSVPFDCVWRLLHPLFNPVRIFHSTQLKFIHYSFFEYLVAHYMARALVMSCSNDSMDIYSYFVKDMTPEIRHHLMRIINRIKPTGFGKWLTKGYSAINEDAPDNVRRRIANNLLVYILGRLNEDISNEMRELLQSEDDEFLKEALYWGLCAVEGLSAVREYINVLESDNRMRHLNRGYHLYYYSDLERDNDSPYLDDDPSRDWANTKLRTLQFMADSEYHSNINLGRRILDLYTFYDFCIFRKQGVSGDDEAILSGVLSVIEEEIEDKNIIQRLREMHKQATGTASPPPIR